MTDTFEDDYEPTYQEVERAKVVVNSERWDMVSCRGTWGEGCGSKFSILKARVLNGGFICPKCGARN